jgi:hypothetical protein
MLQILAEGTKVSFDAIAGGFGGIMPHIRSKAGHVRGNDSF